MTISVLINGAFGRMGQITSKAIQENADFELVGQIGREYDLTKSIKDSEADVVVDFTHPDAVFKNAMDILNAGARPVIGTSGLKDKQIAELIETAAKLKRGGIIAPNFSLGAILMMKHAREIAKYFPNVEIIEMHHPDKADSPSGTALRTANIIADAVKNINQPEKTTVEKIVQGSRGANYRDIPIHAVRLPGFLAHEMIIFGSMGETLTLRHDAIDRQSFMPGIFFACKKVMEMDHMVYGLEELL